MAIDALTTSGINTTIQTYTDNEVAKRITPINTRITTYQNMNSAWTDLSTKLNALKSAAYDLQSANSSTYFGAKSATSSNSTFVTATATKDASIAAFTMRVNQLAKNDIAVSNTLTSATSVTNMSGTHTLQFTSGGYTAAVDVSLTDSETNGSIMQKIADAVNGSKAVVSSASVDGATTFTGAGTFNLNLNGTTTAIAYDYSSGKSYSDVVDDLATKINSAMGGNLVAEKVVNGSNVSLKMTVSDSTQYLSVDQTSDTGGLLGNSNLKLSADKVKAASGLVSAAVFTPSTGNSKISFTSTNSGYDNRIQMLDKSGSALNFLGLDAATLASHKQNADDNSAGFIYGANSSTDNQLNAKVIFNGINIQSNTNTLDTLATGVTFNLNSTMLASDKDVTVNIQSNVAAVQNKLSDFFAKFNAVYQNIKNKSNTDSSGRGLFVGDETASALLRSMTNISIGKVAGIQTSNLSYLTQLGITFDPATGLSLSDSSKLSSAISNKPDQVAALFNSSSGIAASMYNQISKYVGSDGVIAHLQTSLSTTIKYNQDKVTSLQASIDKSAKVLRDQYNRLQSQYINLINASNAFTSAYSSSSSSTTG